RCGPNEPTKSFWAALFGGGFRSPPSAARPAAGQASVIAALCGLDVVDQIIDVRVAGQLGAQPDQRLGGVELRFDQDLHRPVEVFDRLAVEALAAQADR